MTIALIILSALVISLFGLGCYFARVLVFPYNRTYEETLASELENQALEKETWEQIPKQAVSIPSIYRYALAGYYLPVEKSRKLVVVSHGITNNLIGSIKYARIFQSLGFNTLIYDHRNHGRSGGKNTTFGYYERRDLITMVSWARENLGPFDVIGVHGESMGAAIAILAAALEPIFDFVVSDCSYAHLGDQLAFRLQEDFHLPAFPLIPLAQFWARILTGMRFKALHPQKAISEIQSPALIIHGAEDNYIPPEHARRLAEAPAEKERPLWLAPGADHAESLYDHPGAYAEKVSSFLKTHGWT
jgi:hypothetical protein